jgi:hypothetical protein
MTLIPVTDEKLDLIKKIEFLRAEMIRIGMKEGLHNEKTVRISQKLDTYIAYYQNSRFQLEP